MRLWYVEVHQLIDGKWQTVPNAIEAERDQLRAALQGMVTRSFYGDSTGYYHVEPDAYQEARRVLDSQNANCPPVDEKGKQHE